MRFAIFVLLTMKSGRIFYLNEKARQEKPKRLEVSNPLGTRSQQNLSRPNYCKQISDWNQRGRQRSFVMQLCSYKVLGKSHQNRWDMENQSSSVSISSRNAPLLRRSAGMMTGQIAGSWSGRGVWNRDERIPSP